MTTDSIFALSSGLPPAGIAVIRVSGPGAGTALEALAGKRLPPRRASAIRLRDPRDGGTLDEGLAVWFPGPASATGEDVAEFHVHGGRAVVAAVLDALGHIDGLRPAQAGEFTRRGFEQGRLDLTAAEGLADLLAAETESQRRSALALAEGGLARKVGAWQAQLLRIAAMVEAELDFSDEGDVSRDSGHVQTEALSRLAGEMADMLAQPPAERLRDGVRIVLAGPPNSGKSSLFNALVGRQAAIVTDQAGTTRDRIEAPVALAGVPLLLVDTAGLRDNATDDVELIGIERTGEAMAEADIIMWLGGADDAPPGALLVAPKADLGMSGPGIATSALTGEGVDQLRATLIERAHALLPGPGSIALNARHRAILAETLRELDSARDAGDGLILAEHLRVARNCLDRLTGRAGVEDMLDALFGTFCIGK